MKRESDAESILLAETEIQKLINRKAFDIGPIRKIAGKFENISVNGKRLGEHFPNLIGAIDDAILEAFPNIEPWGNTHRSKLLNTYIGILNRIADHKPVELGDLQKVLKFCTAVRSGFDRFHRSDASGR
jgi:hypothetical protein